MQAIVDAVDRIAAIPGAFVDRSILQGEAAIAAQLQFRLQGPDGRGRNVDVAMKNIQAHLSEIDAWVAPFSLPTDYRFFLEYCGGLSIKQKDHYLNVYGVGPVSYLKYGVQKDDEDALFLHGWLKIALLWTREPGGDTARYFDFHVDLGGTREYDSIIAVFVDDLSSSKDLEDLLAEPPSPGRLWVPVAESFTKWLELVAATNGRLGF